MKKDNRVRKYLISIIVMVVIITICSTLALTYAIITRCEASMLKSTSALIDANASQLELNLDSYLSSIEGNVALMFVDEDALKYDSSTTTLDEYERIRIESSIANRISDLGALENYGDFCVVYANDNTVGWKSKTTQNMYPDGGMYEGMCSYLTDNKTQDGWAFGVQDNYDRMYYVKRYNSNAVIIASFYTRELERTFKYPDELRGMTVRLIDNNGYIVYSSAVDEIGTEITVEDKEYLDKGVGVSAITDKDLINTNFCNNGWMVMCQISREEIMSEIEGLKYYAFAFTALVIILVLIIIAIGGSRLSKPMDGYVDDLSEKALIDMLSGVMNRRAYEEEVRLLLDGGDYQESAFVMFDVDNFKKVNDTLGHDKGDAIIARMGKMLTAVLIDNKDIDALVGRIGGDEFTAFIKFKTADNEDMIRHIMDTLLDTFKLEFAEERAILPISLSAGVAVNDNTHKDYIGIYNAADAALYDAKQSGKDRYCMYKEDQTNEE